MEETVSRKKEFTDPASSCLYVARLYFFLLSRLSKKKSEHTEADQGMLVTVYGSYKFREECTLVYTGKFLLLKYIKQFCLSMTRA